MSNERDIRYARSSSVEDMYVPVTETPKRLETRPRFRISRFASALLLLIPASMALANIPGTLLFFQDTEGTTENALGAAPLDFSIDVDTPSAIALTTGEGEAEGDTFTPFVIPLPGTSDFEYRIRVEEQGGDSAFCSALLLKGTPPLFEYDGPLLDLSTATTTETAPWSLLLYLPEDSGISDESVCIVDLVYEGFQEEGDVGQKFHDEERLTLMITADILAPEPAFAPLMLQTEAPVEEPVIEEEPVTEMPIDPEPEPLPEEPESEPDPAPEEPPAEPIEE